MEDQGVDEDLISDIAIEINVLGYSEEQWSKFDYKIRISNENEEDITIGKGEGYILDSPSYDALVEIADEINQWIYDTCISIRPLLCEPASALHVIIIESMELEEKYRRKGIGLKTMNYLLDFFKGDLILIVPCPIKGTYIEEEEEKITEKLRRHWMKCGFKQLGNGDTFYFSSRK